MNLDQRSLWRPWLEKRLNRGNSRSAKSAASWSGFHLVRPPREPASVDLAGKSRVLRCLHESGGTGSLTSPLPRREEVRARGSSRRNAVSIPVHRREGCTRAGKEGARGGPDHDVGLDADRLRRSEARLRGADRDALLKMLRDVALCRGDSSALLRARSPMHLTADALAEGRRD